MQQLSLFDFGAEKPKENKKKVSSKTEKASNASSDDLFSEDVKDEAIETTSSTGGVPEVPENYSTDFIVEELEQEAVGDIDFSEEKENETTGSETDDVAEGVVKKRGRKSFKEMDSEVDLINVPPDEELFLKQYYPISVVAKWFRVNTSLLRFWENQFKILKPKKNKKGDRFFRPEDVKNLQIIYYLLRQKKLTIDGANKHLKVHKQHTEENLQLIQSLNNFKSFLLELKANAES